MTDAPSLHSQAQKKYEERQRAAGLRRKAVWVPEARAEQFRKAYEALRREWKADGLMPEDTAG